MARIIPGLPNYGGDAPDAPLDGSQDPENLRVAQQIWQNRAQAAIPQEDSAPEWWNQSPSDFLNDPNTAEPFDFHNDHEALQAVLPERPGLPFYHDASHAQHDTRVGSLLRVLAYAGMGGLAGRGGNEQMVAQSGGHRSGGVGVGFQYGLQAGQNLQNLALQRQAMKDKSDYQRAQIARMQTQTAGMPQQQADQSKYRQGRVAYLDAQTQKLKAESDKLKRTPQDKLVHSYQADDGKVHFVYQKSTGDQYEKASEQKFYQKPEKPAAIPRPIVGHGHDGIYVIDPSTFKAHKVVSYAQNATRHASPAYFRSVENWKDKEWRKVQNDSFLSDDDKMSRLQEIQDHYESVIATGGGEPAHYDVKTGASPTFNPASHADANDPLGIR
jgi:hypothetical protein